MVAPLEPVGVHAAPLTRYPARLFQLRQQRRLALLGPLDIVDQRVTLGEEGIGLAIPRREQGVGGCLPECAIFVTTPPKVTGECIADNALDLVAFVCSCRGGLRCS